MMSNFRRGSSLLHSHLVYNGPYIENHHFSRAMEFESRHWEDLQFYVNWQPIPLLNRSRLDSQKFHFVFRKPWKSKIYFFPRVSNGYNVLVLSLLTRSKSEEVCQWKSHQKPALTTIQIYTWINLAESRNNCRGPSLTSLICHQTLWCSFEKTMFNLLNKMFLVMSS